MNGDRYFVDTFFAIALLNPRDQAHHLAGHWMQRMPTAREVWTTDLILIEVADAFCVSNRGAAVEFVRNFGVEANARIARLSPELLDRGLALYQSRRDKTWGLTDCISFVVMREQGLTEALTGDQHFIQAGFKAVLK